MSHVAFHPQVQGHLKNLIEEHFKSDLESAMREPILFGDYRTALNESEPRVYEDIQDYDAAKALFQVSPAHLLGLCVRCLKTVRVSYYT